MSFALADFEILSVVAVAWDTVDGSQFDRVVNWNGDLVLDSHEGTS